MICPLLTRTLFFWPISFMWKSEFADKCPRIARMLVFQNGQQRFVSKLIQFTRKARLKIMTNQYYKVEQLEMDKSLFITIQYSMPGIMIYFHWKILFDLFIFSQMKQHSNTNSCDQNGLKQVTQFKRSQYS